VKRLMITAVALVALVGAQPAPTASDKTVAVAITRVGFVPKSVTLATGDTVMWMNSDTVNHQVVSQQAALASPILKPGETYSFAFTKAGRFTVLDALDGKFPKLTVVVKAPPATLTLDASAAAVGYGGPVTLSGKLSSGRADVRIDVLGQQCGQSAAKRIGSVTTSTGGVFTYAANPAKTAIYNARSGAVRSTGVTVKVRPRVVLSKIRTRKFRIRVYAAESLVGHGVLFRRYVAAQRKWLTVKTVLPRVQTSAATPLPGTVVSSVSFGVRLRAGFRVRAVMTNDAAAPCYIAASSATIRS